MSAGLYDITIEQGADWRMTMTWKDAAGVPIALAGYAGRMQVRENWVSRTKIFDLTTENGGIVLDPENGTIALHLPAATSAAVPINPAKTVWVDGKQAQQLVFDLEMVDPDGVVTRLIQGAALFIPEVTK